MSRKTNRYCQKLAQKCDLKQLDGDAEWQLVGKRPKDFVRRLLVLDEEQRMSVSEAKKHSWFSNDFHKVDFEEVYCRATKHWRPRTLKTPVIEVIDAGQLRELPWLPKGDLIGQRNNRKRSLVPMDPPYKPYPRRMSLSLLPKRRPDQSFAMSDEVRIAIEEKWSPERMQAHESHAEDEKVPPLIADLEGSPLNRQPDRPCAPKLASQSVVHTSRPACTLSLRPSYEIDTSMSETAISTSSGADEVSTINGKANRAIPKLDCTNHASTASSTKCILEPSELRTVSQPLASDPIVGDSVPSGVTGAINEVGDAHTDGDGGLASGAAEFCPRDQLVVCKDPSHLTAQVHNNKLIPCQGGQDPPMKERGLSSPAHDSDMKIIAGGPCSARGSLGGINVERPSLKLRCRLSTRLKETPERPSNPKKRRGSVFDLEEDGDAEQSQDALSKMTLKCDGMNLQPGSLRKKIKSGQSRGAQEVVHSAPRLQLRGSGGGFSAIKDGFTNIYLPR